jgi:hypothetical protein
MSLRNTRILYLSYKLYVYVVTSEAINTQCVCMYRLLYGLYYFVLRKLLQFRKLFIINVCMLICVCYIKQHARCRYIPFLIVRGHYAEPNKFKSQKCVMKSYNYNRLVRNDMQRHTHVGGYVVGLYITILYTVTFLNVLYSVVLNCIGKVLYPQEGVNLS